MKRFRITENEKKHIQRLYERNETGPNGENNQMTMDASDDDKLPKWEKDIYGNEDSDKEYAKEEISTIINKKIDELKSDSSIDGYEFCDEIIKICDNYKKGSGEFREY